MNYTRKYFIAMGFSAIAAALIIFAFVEARSGNVDVVGLLIISFIVFAITAPTSIYYKSRKEVDKRKR